jgi:tRNA U34 5-methylaminomethyl-2-thiouridine-forming methyltransferase MnmC
MIEWRNGQPFSSTYQDIYFSTDDGVAETNYVFIEGNQLEARWQSLNTETFTIIETGFGTGLNFLCVCQKWLSFLQYNAQNHLVNKAFNKSYPQLHFISVEKHPLSLVDTTIALAGFASLAPFTQVLLSRYDALLASQTSITLFDDIITLTILQGDATDCLRQEHYQADTWFLDGFAPSKNPDMWQPELFIEIARLSKPNATFATFTSAGVVKRGLQNAGFNVKKRVGFGKKREMLVGELIKHA